jgi:hypothetical protein
VNDDTQQGEQDEARIAKALSYAAEYGTTDGDHHKMWVIDQMVRALTGCPVVMKTGADYRGEPYEYEAQGESPDYEAFTLDEDGNYAWDEGIAP